MTVTQIIAILVSIISFVWAFFNPAWAWAPLFAAALVLLAILLGIKQTKWKHIDELSGPANEMLQKFGHYYEMPVASRDFSSACSTIQFGAVGVGIVGTFSGFWWGLGLAVLFWFVLGPAAMAFNPTNFIRGQPMLRLAHDEVIEWVLSQSGHKEKPDA